MHSHFWPFLSMQQRKCCGCGRPKKARPLPQMPRAGCQSSFRHARHFKRRWWRKANRIMPNSAALLPYCSTQPKRFCKDRGNHDSPHYFSRTAMTTEFLEVKKVQHPIKTRLLTVKRVTALSPGMRRITLTGDDLTGFLSASFDDHVKLMVPEVVGAK